MWWVLLVWVPHFFTNAETSDCVAACQENLGLIRDVADFLGHVISCDETWVHYFNPKSKEESLSLEVAQFSIKKERVPAEIGVKGAHGVFFFNSRGPIYQHAVPRKVKIDAAYYCGVLQQLQRHIRTKRPELKHRWILHHHDARPHTAKIVETWMASKEIYVMHPPPNSPDLASCNFWLFPAVKKTVRVVKSVQFRQQCGEYYPHFPEWYCRLRVPEDLPREMDQTDELLHSGGDLIHRKRVPASFWLRLM